MWLFLFVVFVAIAWLIAASNKPQVQARGSLPAAPERLAHKSISVSYDYRGAPSNNRTPGRWAPPGEAVTVAGHVIPGGMIYVGGVLPARYGRNDNCLIDPDLEVSRTVADFDGGTMSYWPSYSSITKSARRAYLEWLASGRSDPGAYIGYVFLFFYGLERRLFVDGKREEAPLLVAEVERLLSVYGGNHSFRSYARRFIDAASLLADEEPVCEPSLDLKDGFEIAFPVRRRLGRKLAAGERFDAEDALIWVLALPDTFPRTPIMRCFEAFKSLWRIRFAERYPDGLKVRAPESRLRAQYRPASNAFEAELVSETLPDIAAVHAPIDGLRDLLSACADELDGYSRFIGRRPEAKDSPEALLLLPAVLAATEAGAALRRLREAIDARLTGENLAVMPMREVASLLGLDVPEGDRLSPGAARQLGGMLDRLDTGFEPDRRYGALTPSADGPVVLFRANGGGPVDPEQPEHAAARTMVEVAVLAAHADGVVVPVEFEAIGDELKAIPGLGEAERLRLLAFALVLLKDPPKQQAAINRLLKLPTVERLRSTQSAIAAVLADGRVTPAEVKFLERLHKTLGLPQEDVYAALHRGSVRLDEPVPVSPEQWAPGTPIPAEPPEDKVVIAFDTQRLERIRQETSAVSALLADIFTEDEPAPPLQPAPASGGVSAFPGLDAAHASLLATMLAGGACDRERFEKAARAVRLFPDGAIETINDWGFETFDEPVLEFVDEDVITAVEHLRDRLQLMGATT